MHAYVDTAGVRLVVDSALPWVDRLLRECCGSELREVGAGAGATHDALHVNVETSAKPFDTSGLAPLTRGAWSREAEVVMLDVCSSGFDVHLAMRDGVPTASYRWRPPVTSHAAAWVLRSRFHLLVRSVLLHYPAMWWSSTRGAVPLHAPACTVAGLTALLAGPPGVGKTTLLLQEVADGARAISDNLSVTDGRECWGVVEPIRVEGGGGRRMPHGRSEKSLSNRVCSLTPDIVVVVRRDGGQVARVRPCSASTAAQALVASTYMAGELRRYWAFAATLATATGWSDVHPPIAAMAGALTAGLPCVEITLPAVRGTRLAELLNPLETTSCA
jgi:hypothetical protein